MTIFIYKTLNFLHFDLSIKCAMDGYYYCQQGILNLSCDEDETIGLVDRKTKDVITNEINKLI